MGVTLGTYGATGSAGFTQFTASEPSGEGSGHSGAGTRKIYVDSAAADDSGTGSLASPKKTLAAGKALLRDAHADWLLLKCGGVWDEVIDQIKVSGVSATEPMRIGAYGTGARPVVKASTDSSNLLRTAGSGGGSLGGRYLAVTEIKFYASCRDPDSPDFNAGASTQTDIAFFNTMTWFLIEDCDTRFNQFNFQPATFSGTLIFRRNIVADAWATPAHAQGMFVSSNLSVGLIEENFYDHNGWNESIVGAEATVFNHNLYINSGEGLFTVRGNISARASSHGMQCRAGGDVYDNAIIHCPIGMLASAYNSNGVRAYSNVITEGYDIAGSGRGYGIDLNSVNIAGDTQVANVGITSCHDNIIANKANSGSGGHGIQIGSLTTSATVTNNVIFKWDTPIDDRGVGNTTTPNQIDANGDNTEYSFVYPTRSAASYDLLLGGAGTLANFLTTCRARGRGTWDSSYSATAINDYIRAGFGMRRLAPSFTVRLTAAA